MFAELKTSSATGGTKRRRYISDGGAPISKVGKLAKGIARLNKKLKLNNPSHLYALSLPGTFTSISNAGTIYDLGQDIAQGDNYNQRFSSTIQLTRLNIKGVMVPGSAATAPCAARITVIRGQSGLAFAGNVTGTYNPVQTSTSTQLIYDRFFPIAAAPSTAGFATNINLSIKLNHKQKFTGTTTNTTTGTSIYCIIQSGQAGGTSAPTFYCGVMEIFFQPL